MTLDATEQQSLPATGQSPATPPEMLQGDRRPIIYHAAAWMTLISTTALVLRLWSRRLARQKLELDDWLVIASQVLEYVVCGLTITTATNGIGLRAATVYMMPDARQRFDNISKMGDSLLPLVSTGLSLIKLSVLPLYYRLFRSIFMKFSIYILGALVVVWWIVNVVFAAIECRIQWKSQTFDNSGCLLHSTTFLKATTVAVIAINLIIITLPIYEVLCLQMGLWKKLAVCCLFLLGGLSIVAGIIRWRLLQSYYDNQQRDPLYDYATTSILVLLEMCSGITGVCLSAIRPFVKWLKAKARRRGTTSGRIANGSGTAPPISAGLSEPHRHRNLARMNGGSEMGSFISIDHQPKDQHSVELVRIPGLAKRAG